MDLRLTDVVFYWHGRVLYRVWIQVGVKNVRFSQVVQTVQLAAQDVRCFLD